MSRTEDQDPVALVAEIERLRFDMEALRQRAERAEALADHDVLTPALNRRGFVNVLNRQMAYCHRHRQSAVLLYMDLDNFKPLNDQYGHAAGDEALRAVVNILHQQTRESDAVGRLGGDEFAVVMMNASYEDGKAKARRMQEQLQSQGFEWRGQHHALSASIGVRSLSVQTDPEVWLAEADTAMWLRKAEKPSSR